MIYSQVASSRVKALQILVNTMETTLNEMKQRYIPSNRVCMYILQSDNMQNLVHLYF